MSFGGQIPTQFILSFSTRREAVFPFVCVSSAMAVENVQEGQRKEIIFPLQSLKSGPTKFKAKDIDKTRRRLLKPEGKTKLCVGGNNPTDGSETAWASDVDLQAYVVYMEGSSQLYFKVPDIEAIKAQKCSRFKMIECRNLSAADLKVSTKFGSWKTMNGRLLVECHTPVLAWSRLDNATGIPTANTPDHILQSMKCYMVKAVFDLKHIDTMRDILHNLKLARLTEKKLEHGAGRAQIREGLPEWVNYIPYQWYSTSVRQTLEYMFLIYTLLSLSWAMWQLYKHVDFIRASILPVKRLIEHYLKVAKTFFNWMDGVLIVLTDHWWTYLKPGYMIIATIALPFTTAFKPMQQLMRLLPSLLDPFIKFFMVFYQFFKPIISPLAAVIDVIIIRSLKSALSTLSFVAKFAYESPLTKMILQRGSQLAVVQVINEALHGKFDPLRAQLFVVQTIVTKSLRSVFIGLRFIMSRLYYLVIFIRRERDYAKEEASKQPISPMGSVPASFSDTKSKDE